MKLMVTSLKKFFVFLLFFVLGNAAFSTQPKPNSTQDTTVMILQIVEHPALNVTRQGIEDELKTASINTIYESAQGNPALASQIAQKYVGSHPSVLVGIGTAATQALVAENRSHHIPVVFSSVTEPLKARLLNNLKHPDGSVTGVSNYIEVSKSLDFFKALLPKLSKLGVIYNPGEINSVALLEETKIKARDRGITIVTAIANNSSEIPTATRKLVSEVDAIFINNDNTALSAFESITKIASQYQIPVFVSDTDLIKYGALAALGPNQYLLGRQTGAMILKVLKGTKIQDIPVEFPKKTDIILNTDVIHTLNLSLPDSIKQQCILWVKS